MKNPAKPLATVTALLLLAAPAAFAATYQIDPAHTFPQFQIRHLSFSLMHGQFNHTTGTITMDHAKGLGSVNVTIAVDSIDTGDAQRNKDLMAPSFFDAAKYPTMTYRSTKVMYHGKDTATVYGNLTLKGTTKPVTLTVTRIYCGKNPFGAGERCGFDATADIKRSDFGVSADLPVIPDAVHIILNSDAVSESATQGD
ncbi:MAG: YceI family protein [Gammaproteobacteria bacterium]